MKGYANRQRVAECGCHYDVKTQLITHYCSNLMQCKFKEERLQTIKATLAAPGMGHVIGVK